MEAMGRVSSVQRHLIILDGHASHVSIQIVKEAHRYGIDLLTLPSHSSHAMQPLDICLFKPFKTAFKAYRDYWNYRYLGTAAKKENLSQWVCLALKKALTLELIRKGFSTCGIWPINSQAMVGRMGPLEVYRPVANDIASDFAICIEEIQLHVEEPADPKRQHYFMQVDADEDPKPAEVGDDMDMVGCEVKSTVVPTSGAQPQLVIQFFSLLLVTTTGHTYQS